MTRDELISKITLDIDKTGWSVVHQQEVWPALTCREGVPEDELLSMLREFTESNGWEFQVMTNMSQPGMNGYFSFYPPGNPPKWPQAWKKLSGQRKLGKRNKGIK